MLNGRVDALSTEIERMARQRPAPELELEMRGLRTELQDKSIQNERLAAQVRELMHDADKQGARQKQEWADIYGSMKSETDDLKRDMKHLN